MNQTNLLNEHHSSTCLASFSALGLGDRKSSKLCPCLILPLHAPPPPMAGKDTILTLINIDLPYRSFHVFPGNLVGSWLIKKAHLQKPPASQALKTHVHGHLCLSCIPQLHWKGKLTEEGEFEHLDFVLSFRLFIVLVIRRKRWENPRNISLLKDYPQSWCLRMNVLDISLDMGAISPY